MVIFLYKGCVSMASVSPDRKKLQLFGVASKKGWSYRFFACFRPPGRPGHLNAPVMDTY